MERTWTDERSGTEWTVTRVGGVGVPGATHSGGEADADPLALVFHADDERYTVRTERAAGLEDMNDDQLQGLLDAAREGATGTA